MHRLPCLALFLLVVFASPLAWAEGGNLLSNGDFEDIHGGEAADWPMPSGASIEKEDGSHFLRLTADPSKMLTVYRRVYVDPSKVSAMKLTFRYRSNELKRGSENWHDGRIILEFKNSSDQKVNPKPSHPSFNGTTDGWVEKTVAFRVPEDAQYLELMPAMFKAASGSYDLDDLMLTATTAQAVIDAKEARFKPQIPVARADQMPPILQVKGNQIVKPNGKTFWLQGVAIPSMERSGAGEHILESVREAMTHWNSNVIRLPIRENFWNGTGPYQNDGGRYYRQLVDDVVNLAAANGVYTVLDLHRFRAPKIEHAEFWTNVATKYKDHPAVLFELFNEPHDVSWSVWQSGGFVSTKKKDSDALTENQDKLQGFEALGMQDLIDAVRDTGANNIVIVGGLDWAYDLSGILKGYTLDDRGGHGIVYSTHVYPWKSNWKSKFMAIAEKHPIFIGECGAPQERMSFIPEERHEDPSTWVPDFLGLVQKHKYHWTAWSFHPRASPVLLEDWTYTPNAYWGVPAKEALNGRTFELTRLR